MESKCEEEDGGGTAKRIKLCGDQSPVMEVVAKSPQQVGPSLLDLSDDVLLIILAFLSPADLINLSQSCSRLWEVTRDRTLWSHVDCRDSLLDAQRFEADYLDYLLPTTKYLAVDFRVRAHRPRKKGEGRSKLRADAHSQGPLTVGLLGRIASVCVGLDTLILQDVCFDAQQIPFGQFPSTLTHLSLKNSDVQNLPVRVSYFNDIHVIMPNIQVLILSHSLWLESHSLMAISKCVKLRELRLQGCYALGDCMAYFSIATRFGFKDLETLDLRGTQVGDPEVSCLNMVPSIRHLYLESITQYARRRDAEYYMNRVRQYPDITIVPHPNSGPVQNPVILLQRIDGEMVARNVTGEFHGLGRPRDNGVGPQGGPGTSAPVVRRLRERWQVPEGPPVIVVPVKRPRARLSGPGALEDALRLRGVITLIHDNMLASGATPAPGTSKCRKTEGEAGPSSSGAEGGDAGAVGGGDRAREVKVEMGRVVVHLNNVEAAGPSAAPAPAAPAAAPAAPTDYREYFTRLLREEGSSQRSREGGGDPGGPCCSHVGSSVPGCSKYGDRRTPEPPGRRRFDRGPTADDSDSDDDRPRAPTPAGPLHFCTVGRARLSGLTVPFFHRVPQVTDACVHAVCGGGLATLPREPARLHTLVLRHYPKVTDQSLYVLSRLTSLRRLDVTGTSVTACGLKNFRLMRPDVEVTSDHDLSVEP